MDTAESPSPQPAPFQPELRDFADRIRWVRVFVLRLNSISEMARRLEYPSQTVETWEKGARPRDLIEVARRYHKVAPEVPVAWLLTGSGPLVTYLDIVDDPQLRLPYELPPSRSDTALTLVGGDHGADRAAS